jgi:hypothetical protein
MTARSKNLQRKSKVSRQRDPIPWKYCLLTLVCGLILVAGFFYAARLHFASMDYGMKNAKLRKQIEELNSEKRRHELLREIALTPAQIKKAAQKLGLTTMSANNIEVGDSKSTLENDVDKSGQKAFDGLKKAKSSTETEKNGESEKDNLEKSKKKNDQIEIKKAELNKTGGKNSVAETPKTKVTKK